MKKTYFTTIQVDHDVHFELEVRRRHTPTMPLNDLLRQILGLPSKRTAKHAELESLPVGQSLVLPWDGTNESVTRVNNIASFVTRKTGHKFVRTGSPAGLHLTRIK